MLTTSPSVLAIVFGLLIAGSASAAIPFFETGSHQPNDDQTELDELVREALACEIYGESEERTALLEEVLQQDPDHALARWNLGYVRHGDQWLKPAELAEEYQANTLIRRYLERRQGAEDTVEDQLELAEWCEQRSLHDQEMAHLYRVLQLAPNHEYARTRLGFRLINNEWVAAEDIADSLARNRKAQEDFQQWGEQVAELRQRLYGRNRTAREMAQQQFLELDDASTIPAIEAIFGMGTRETALLAVQATGSMSNIESSTSLARQAVYSPWPEVRQAAGIALSEREAIEFVPELLAELRTPIMTMEQILPGRGRRLVHRKVYITEDQDKRQAHVQDSGFHRVLPLGNRELTWNQVMTDVGRESQLEDLQIQVQNLQTEELNERICDTLRTATGVDLPTSPQAWWDWWNQDNDILIEGSKPVSTTYSQRETDIGDRYGSTPTPPQSTASAASQRPISLRATQECLVQGTPVVTVAGPQPIEQISVGDLVLAKDAETGELCYRPVIRTTRRQAGPIVAIRLPGERIESSPGHPFWVSGEGWVRAKELKSGMELHCLDGIVRISDVSASGDQPTFNLVVEGCATYFAGQHQVLSHDHTMPAAIAQQVPGLKP